MASRYAGLEVDKKLSGWKQLHFPDTQIVKVKCSFEYGC